MDHDKIWMGLCILITLACIRINTCGFVTICTVTALLLMFTPMPPPGSPPPSPVPSRSPSPVSARAATTKTDSPEKDDKPVKKPPTDKQVVDYDMHHSLRRRLRRPSDSRVKLERATFDDFVANGFRP